MTEIRLITSNLTGEIKELTQSADNIYWIVAFAMKFPGYKKQQQAIQPIAYTYKFDCF
ncbi:hypothetical protein [Sporosarcina sp. FA9]|uniref:hypothetical protein n=1 Tax=Sporosarcina sp. FA9 TaxID=3413030 RepID=UPI003F656A10